MKDGSDLFEKFQEFVNKKKAKIEVHKDKFTNIKSANPEMHWRLIARKAAIDLVEHDITDKDDIIDILHADLPNTRTHLLQSVLDKLVKYGDLEVEGDEYQLPTMCACTPTPKIIHATFDEYQNNEEIQ